MIILRKQENKIEMTSIILSTTLYKIKTHSKSQTRAGLCLLLLQIHRRSTKEHFAEILVTELDCFTK